jgi:hypothetical protein
MAAALSTVCNAGIQSSLYKEPTLQENSCKQMTMFQFSYCARQQLTDYLHACIHPMHATTQ